MNNKLTTEQIMQIVGLVGKIVFEICAQKDFMTAINDGMQIATILGIQNHVLAAMMGSK